MNGWIALLRGINVGGRHVLPMAELRGLLTELGCVGVQTYIQSGNVVFQSRKRSAATLAVSISEAIERQFGFRPDIFLLKEAQLREAVTSNPFQDVNPDPRSVHLYFLHHPPESPDLTALDAVKTKTERYELRGDRFYLHTPDGIGHSRLAALVERHLHVSATARNWRTVIELLKMVETRHCAK